MKTKRIVSLIVLLAMALLLCTTVFSADSETETKGDFIYQKGTNKILAYTGDGGVCEIPENTVLGGIYNVNVPHGTITKLVISKGVNFNALNGLEDLKEIEFKEGITEIPDNIMVDCEDLEKVIFPSTLKKIGDNAFSKCPKITGVQFYDGLEYIGEGAFSYLKSLSGDIIIPDTVTFMGFEAFAYCGDLNKVHISDNVSFVHEKPKSYHSWDYSTGWFSNVYIKEINIPNSMLDNPIGMYSADEITFNSDMTVNIYKAVEHSSWCYNKYLKGKTDKSLGSYDGFAIAENTVLKYIGTNKNPTVPDGVKVIGENAFEFCDIDTVVFPKSLETIEKDAFYWSTLKSIVIPQNVKSIGDSAFEWCPLLEKVTFECNPEIGLNSFVVSDVLTEDNIIFDIAAPKTKEKILSYGITEYGMYEFYDTLNKNRKKIGFNEITVPREYQDLNAPKTNDKQQTPVVSSENTEPKTTAEPTITLDPPAPTKAPLTVKGGDNISISVGDEKVTFPDAQPFIDENNRTQIPIRAVAEMLDCTVDWDKETETAIITREDGRAVTLTIGSDVMIVNNTETNIPVQMDTAAMIKYERTYIPVRFVAEAMGLTVEWSK